MDGTEGRGDDGMIKAFCQVGKSTSKDFGITASGRFWAMTMLNHFHFKSLSTSSLSPYHLCRFHSLSVACFAKSGRT